MEAPLLLSNSKRSDRLLKTKLGILKKTLRIRGVEIIIVKSSSTVYSKVHGFNNIDLEGDRADETKVTKSRLILNLNNLVRIGEKGFEQQVCYHYEDIADEGDIIIYRSSIYEYSFKVDRKQSYGEKDFLYEYTLDSFRVIRLEKDKRILVNYDPKPIDKEFENYNGTKAPEKMDTSTNPPRDWRSIIDKLDIID